MHVVTDVGIGRSLHEGGIGGVVGLGTKLIGEVDGEVKTIEFHGSAKTAIERSHTLLLGHIVAGIGISLGGLDSFPNLFAVFVRFGNVLVPEGFTRLLIDAGEFLQIPAVQREAFGDEGASGSITFVHVTLFVIYLGGLLFRVQFENLVVNPGEVYIHIPTDVLGVDNVAGKVNFNTLVAHVTHIGIVGAITHGRSHREGEEHVGGLAIEEVCRTAQAAVKQREFYTGVQVALGFPGDALTTLGGELGGHVAGRIDDIVQVRITVRADIVVTLGTVGEFQFEFVDGRGLEPRLLAHDPGCTHRPEGTPTVIRVEAGRGVTTIGGRCKDLALVVVLQTGEVTFVVVLGDGGTGTLAIHHCTVQFLVGLGEHLGLAAPGAIALGVVVLVTQEGAHRVVTEGLVVVEELLEVIGDITIVLFGNGTTGGVKLTIIRVVHISGTGLVQIGGGVHREFQERKDDEVCISIGRQGVTLTVAGIQLHVHDRVGIANEGTAETGVQAGTIVHHLKAVGVNLNLAVSGADVSRIDRGHLGSESPDITGGRGRTVVAQGVEVELGIGHVGTNLEPTLGIVGSTQTARQTGVVGVLGDTLVVQVADGGENRSLAGSTGNAHIVFLAETVAISDIGPVVGRYEIIFTIVSDNLAQGSVGVDLAIGTKEFLSLGNRPDIITQTAGITGSNVGIDTGVGIQGAQAQAVLIVVVQSAVLQFVVHFGIGNHVVIHQSAGVYTHLGVEGHQGLSTLGGLGGDHDNTVSTTGTVQGVGGGILQNGHALDIGRVDIAYITAERSAVHDNQRIVAGRNGADTTDAHGRGATRSTVGRNELDTGHLTSKGVGNGGNLRLLQFLGIHHGCRSGEGLSGCRTEGHHDGLVQQG